MALQEIWSSKARLQTARVDLLEWLSRNTQDDVTRDLMMTRAGVRRMTKTILFDRILGYYIEDGYNQEGSLKRNRLSSHLTRYWRKGRSDRQKAYDATPERQQKASELRQRTRDSIPNMPILYLATVIFTPATLDLTPYRDGQLPWSDLVTNAALRKKHYFGKWKSDDGIFGMRNSHFNLGNVSDIKDLLQNAADPCICLQVMVILCNDLYTAEQGEGMWMAYGDQYNLMTDTETFIVTGTAAIPPALETWGRNLANEHAEDGTSFLDFVGAGQPAQPPQHASLADLQVDQIRIQMSSIVERWIAGSRDEGNEWRRVRNPATEIQR